MEKVQEEQRRDLESFQLKSKSQELELDCEVEGQKKRGRVVVSLRSRGKIVFSEMDKFERWMRGRDVCQEKQVGIFGFLNIWFTPIQPLVKEWLHGIIWYPKKIDLMVQGQPISLIEKTIGEMLRLPNAGITIPLNYK